MNHSWGNDQYMANMMAMPGMMPNMMPPGHMGAPLMPPYPMMGDMNQMQMHQMGGPMPNQVMGVPMANQPQPAIPPPQPSQLIGPIIPEPQPVAAAEEVDFVPDSACVEQQDGAQQNEATNKRQSRDRNDRDKNDRRDRDRDREGRGGRRRSRSPRRDFNRDRSGRGDRNRGDHRERHSKWDHNDKIIQQQQMAMQQSNMMMGGQPMMQYGNMMPQNQMMPNQMMNPQIDMAGMQQMMPGMHMQQMMPNHMMMMNQQNMMQQSQTPYFSKGMILPALPNTSTPARREKPPGCRTIFIGGLPDGITESVIMEIFQRFGEINDVKLHKQGVCHVRFEKPESVEMSFGLSGSRLKFHDQTENEATTLFIDYALNREDQNEYEKNKRLRSPTPPRVEPFNPNNFASVGEKIKSDNEFAEAAPSLVAWLERGECNKKNSNIFYSLIQASNNQLRRLFNEKMQIDEEYQTMRNTMKEKFGHIILQFEQVAKILIAAKHQRVSDHFSKQQRRNIEMWLKMTEEVENIREEFNAIFEEDETLEKLSKNVVPLEKYEQLRVENENLMYELEGYKNEAHLAKDEAERKFEKFKAHFIAQQALQNKQVYPPLPPPPMPNIPLEANGKPAPPPPLPDEVLPKPVAASEAKLISLLSGFLMVHPLGATLDYLTSYVKSLAPTVTQSAVNECLNKYNDVFRRKTSGVGACIEHKWSFVIFDAVKVEM